MPVHRVYGLIGFPLTHSFSQTFFNQKFKSEGIDAEYINFEISDIGELGEVLAENPDLEGLNVTIPYKEQIIGYLNEIDENARRIGAVNVVKVMNNREGVVKLKGYNSDVVGFRESIAPLITPDMTHALVLGGGGAAKAVRVALDNLGIESTIVSRNPGEGQLGYDQLTPDVIAANLIIVNTTPLGMYPNVDRCPDIPYDLLTPRHLCYDLLYNPDVTKFMRLSAEHGAQTKNGLEMLLLQAFESYRIWTE